MPSISTAVSGVLLNGRKVLLTGRVDERGDILWAPPGGKIRGGESQTLALVREFFEETGLDVRIVRFLGEVEVTSPSASYVIMDYLVQATDSKSASNARAGSDACGLRWFERKELDETDLAVGVHQFFARFPRIWKPIATSPTP